MTNTIDVRNVRGRVVHCKKAPYDIYVGRPGLLSNPYTHLPLSATSAQFSVSSVQEAVDNFRSYALWRMETDPVFARAIQECKGKVLGCWCGPKKPCHARVILELASL